MLRIALADDDPYVLKNLAKALASVEATVYFYDDLVKLDKERDICEFDIYILDIKFNQGLGIDYAKIIRQTNKKAKIIFITAYPQYALEGYEVEAMGYLVKPIDKDKLLSLVKRAIKELSQERLVSFVENKQSIYLLESDIILIEKVDRLSLVHTADGDVYETYLAPKDFKDQVPYFIYINKSQLVNPSFIKAVSSDKNGPYALIKETGSRLYFSRRCKRDFDKSYSDFLVDYYG